MIANLDMTDPTQQCPDGFKLINGTEPPLRTCGRPDGVSGCVSTTLIFLFLKLSILTRVGESLHGDLQVDSNTKVLASMTIMCLALASLVDSLDSTSILLLMHKVKVIPVRFVPVSEILPLYHSLWVMTISVTLLIEVPGKLMICFSPTIHSGMVRDVGVPALAVSSTIHHGSVSNFLSQLLMILK